MQKENMRYVMQRLVQIEPGRATVGGTIIHGI
jgi:hypothetical protein